MEIDTNGFSLDDVVCFETTGAQLNISVISAFRVNKNGIQGQVSYFDYDHDERMIYVNVQKLTPWSITAAAHNNTIRNKNDSR